MRYGITLLGNRVAPRSTCADSVLVVVLRRHQARPETTAALPGHSLLDLAKVLSDNRVDTLVCGGISREDRDYLTARQIAVVDNVAASMDELLAALDTDTLRPGFGLNTPPPDPPPATPHHQQPSPGSSDPAPISPIDCLACRNRVCLNGQQCNAAAHPTAYPTADQDTARIREAALDISFENERTLCRLSELIYFCLEMRYQRIGLAYCVDLEEPATILARVLRRFFKVYPVCCKIEGSLLADPLTQPTTVPERSPARDIACNPAAQAEALNRLQTDLNVIVGLCMGSDCIFTQCSKAPVTTLFVKDKSLANNPIGAVYSDYYIKEAIRAAPVSAHKEP